MPAASAPVTPYVSNLRSITIPRQRQLLLRGPQALTWSMASRCNSAICNNASTTRVPPPRWASTASGPFIPIRCRSSIVSLLRHRKKSIARGRSLICAKDRTSTLAWVRLFIKTRWSMRPACPSSARSWLSPEKQDCCKVHSRPRAARFMSSATNPGLHQELKSAVRELCQAFPDSYWREVDSQRAYPEAFVQALTKAGYMGTLIPEEYGGAGMGVTEAAAILEEIHFSGGNAAGCHAQMYVMGTLLRYRSDMQKKKYLPALALGELRLQAFGVSEPTTGSDTTQMKTFARRMPGDEA